MTLLLSRADVERTLDLRECLSVLENGFRAGSGAVRPERVRTDLPGPGTATALIPGLLEGVPAYSVKVNAKFPGAEPALRGVICLHDLATGALLALVDSASVTAWRTGLSAAIGTQALARSDARDVAVVGAGAQADLMVRGLATLRPLHRLVVHDLDDRRAAAFAARHHTRVASSVVVGSASAAARGAGIVICATWAREPLLRGGDLVEGQHVTSVGADEPGKSELAGSVLLRARVFVDDVRLAVAMGALGNAGLTAEAATGTLRDVLTGEVAGRRTPRDITVYAPVGLPWQDLALAWLCYRRATECGGTTEFDFLTDAP